MSKLYMLAGAVAPGTDPASERVSAYVVLTEGGRSRLFKLTGTRAEPRIEELDAATTLDLKRFRDETKNDLAGLGALQAADGNWACEAVRTHLREDLGI